MIHSSFFNPVGCTTVIEALPFIKTSSAKAELRNQENYRSLNSKETDYNI
jgi:hypothetical protein